MSELHVRPEIWDLYPGMRIAVVRAAGVDNRSPRPAVAAAWRAAWEAAGGYAVDNAQSHPRVAPWREAIRATGAPAKKFPASIEALLRRALKGGEPFAVNPLVDFYNAVSLRHAVPAGGFDLGAAADDPIELRRTREGDGFRALGGDGVEAVPPGEVAYVAGSDVLTRHFVWRQSERAAIRPETADVVLMSEILPAVEAAAGGEGVLDAVLADLAGGLESLFGVAAEPAVLDAGRPRIAW